MALRLSNIFPRLLLLLLGGLVLAGCGGRGSSPDVPAGRFTAQVEGTVSDTLRGEAFARRSGDELLGLELGPEDGAGLSIELEPRPLALRTYEVVDAELFRLERPDTPPGLLAFLRLEHAQFEAVDGTLELTYVNEDRVGATFSFQMEGAFEEGGEDGVSVEVTGELNASSDS